LINAIYVALIVTSHVAAGLPLLQAIRRGETPPVVQFGVGSFFLYYDSGLLLELMGYYPATSLLPGFFSGSLQAKLVALPLLMCAPWLLLGGAHAAKGATMYRHQTFVWRSPVHRLGFVIFAITCSAIVCWYAWSYIATGESIWSTRARIGAEWGTLILMFYVPLHLLAFVLTSRARWDFLSLALVGILVVATIIATIPLGQRTMVLLPMLMITLFGGSPSLKRVALTAGILLLAAALLLPMFKWQYAESDVTTGDLLTETVTNDLARAPVLAVAIDRSTPLGTDVMPYPFAGYVYSALFFLPRSWIPQKGFSTATELTADLVGSTSVDTDWGIGVGAVEEIVINGGLLAAVPGLFLYGFAMGWMDRVGGRRPTLSMPTRLASLWCCGYNLPALLLIFGVMSAVCELLRVMLMCTAENPGNYEICMTTCRPGLMVV